MVKIRFSRFGRKKAPVYRIVAIDSRNARDGKALEFLGTVNPKATTPIVKVNMDGINRWKSCGARLSRSVHRVLARASLMEAPAVPKQTKQHLPKKQA